MTTRTHLHKELGILAALFVLGAVIAYVDHVMNLHTILVEVVHALVVTTILGFCLACQVKYPEIRQFGWNKIVWGVALLMIGSWIDILDDPPTLHLLDMGNVPFGRSWQQAFLKKILGYTAGVGLIALGFFQWIPWMIETRLNVERLNQKMSLANKNMNRLLMSLDEHVESERLNISRELHDDVAQQLTFVNLQVQMCQKALVQTPEKVAEFLKQIGHEISETLKSVRQISGDLRPEPLYALGLVPALEQFLDKLRQQYPDVRFSVDFCPLTDEAARVRIETRFNDRELLHLYRVLQESVRNSVKHGQAKAIGVSIQETAEGFCFSVSDDGMGLPWADMPTEDALVQNGHLGIAGMKERVKELNGTFSLVNQPQGGTCMEVTLAK